MKVFISHSSRDAELAEDIKTQFEKNNIECYLDILDERLVAQRGIPRIVETILKELEKCDVLLGVITANTNTSWWVPFEIGVARSNTLTVASYTDSLRVDLPEFLLDCPIVSNLTMLEKYIQRLGEDWLRTSLGEGMESFSITSSDKRKKSLQEVYAFESKVISELK